MYVCIHTYTYIYIYPLLRQYCCHASETKHNNRKRYAAWFCEWDKLRKSWLKPCEATATATLVCTERMQPRDDATGHHAISPIVIWSSGSTDPKDSVHTWSEESSTVRAGNHTTWINHSVAGMHASPICSHDYSYNKDHATAQDWHMLSNPQRVRHATQ